MNKLPRTLILGSLATLLSGGCGSLDVPDLNDPGLDTFQTSPTPAAIAAAAVGLLIEMRDDMAANNGYISHLGVLGRESYNFDEADPRFVTELLEGPLNPGNRVFGGNFWENPYKNIRAGNILLAATDAVAGLDAAQKEAVRGFVKTIMALEYLRVINTHDSNGAVIQVSADPRTLDPIVSKEMVFAHINKLLDEAKTHLAAGGMAFPLNLGSGFTGFDTPMTFLKANRAIKARVSLYIEDHQAALTALSESFLTADPAMPNLDLGIYLTFSTASGDRANPLNSPNIFVNPSVRRAAEMRPGGEIDARFAAKVAKGMAKTYRELTSDEVFTMYDSPSARIPIIRNEELILIRAESSAAAGNLVQAAMDLNFIREKSGGLAPRVDLTSKPLIDDEVLKQRFLSLLFEGGHRWLDMRRLDRLDQLPNDHPQATMDVPAHLIHARFPIPLNEQDARMTRPAQ